MNELKDIQPVWAMETVSLLKWWEHLLGPGESAKPVPVFIALNEFNQVPEGKRQDLIVTHVSKNYGGDGGEPLVSTGVKICHQTLRSDENACILV